MDNISVSVIIPVYNKQDYIKSCIDSILCDNTCSIEIIAVDDGSKDKSISVIEDICSGDFRVKLITKENGGSSSARNMGIKYAKGDYILFVDADDYLAPGAIDKLYNKAIKNDLDVVVFDIIKEYVNKSEVWPDFNISDNEVLEGSSYLNDYFYGCCIPSACNKLWKRKLFTENNIYFPEDIDFGEDGATVPRLIINAHKVGKINEGFYHYKIHESSKIFNNNGKVYQYIDSYNIVMNYLNKKGFIISDIEKFNYKYTYAYKMLESVVFFKSNNKNRHYLKLYNEFLQDISNNNSYIVKYDNKFFNKKSFYISNIILKSYKINRYLGEMIKSIIILLKRIKNIK